MNSSSQTAKADRVYIRASAEEKEKLARAAQALRTSRSQFVLHQALDAADRILAEQTRFVLPAEEWQAFCDRLDAPTRELPKLSALAHEPSPFDEV